MSKFTYLVLAAAAVILSSVYADEDGKAGFRQAMGPLVAECRKEFSISEAELQKAKEENNPDGLKSCFIGCVFKKFGIITNNGEYDADASLTKIRSIVKNDDDFAKLKDIGEKCTSVNDAPVSDGDAGCERARLLAKCFMENRSQLSI